MTEFERQVLEEIRGAKRAVRGLSILFGVVLLAIVIPGLVGAVVRIGDDDGRGSGRGADVHARFTPGTTAEVVTESGATVRATIPEFTWRQGPVFVARVRGGEPRSLNGNAWTFVLFDGLVLALSREETADQTYRFWLDGNLPADGKVRYIHFDPDDSYGDIYFDVNQR